MLNTNKLLNITARDGKALVIAMDHGRTGGVTPGLENPEEVLEQILDAGADAFMSSFGILSHYAPLLAGHIPTILRVDGGISLYQRDWLDYDEWRLLYTLDDAHALGVSGVVVMTFIGAGCELQTLEITASVSAAALKTDLVVMAEALPVKCERIPDPLAVQPMADAGRLAFEHGADVIKNYYTGSVESFRTVTETIPVPVMIAGGVQTDNDRTFLQSVKDAMTAGAKGAVIGRNLWQHSNAAGMTRALSRIIHEDISVDEALSELGDAVRV